MWSIGSKKTMNLDRASCSSLSRHPNHHEQCNSNLWPKHQAWMNCIKRSSELVLQNRICHANHVCMAVTCVDKSLDWLSDSFQNDSLPLAGMGLVTTTRVTSRYAHARTLGSWTITSISHEYGPVCQGVMSMSFASILEGHVTAAKWTSPTIAERGPLVRNVSRLGQVAVRRCNVASALDTGLPAACRASHLPEPFLGS